MPTPYGMVPIPAGTFHMGQADEDVGQTQINYNKQVTIGSLLAHVRRGDVVKVHSLRRGAAEAIEAVAHGDKTTSKVVGRRIDEIALPVDTTIGAIVRGEEVLMAHHDTVIEAEDHVILFLVDRSKISAVEKLFQVGLTFF